MCNSNVLQNNIFKLKSILLLSFLKLFSFLNDKILINIFTPKKNFDAE